MHDSCAVFVDEVIDIWFMISENRDQTDVPDCVGSLEGCNRAVERGLYALWLDPLLRWVEPSVGGMPMTGGVGWLRGGRYAIF